MTFPFGIGKAALAAATLALLIVHPTAAAAEADNTVEEAKQHFKRGVSFYKDGDLDAALAEFNKAYETRPDYRILYNIGQVQAERHDNAAAVKVLRQYLKEGEPGEIADDRRGEVAHTLRDLSKRVGSVTVTANVTDAEVVIDGVSVGAIPLGEPLAVNAGIREFTVRKGGRTAPPRRVTVAGGDVLQLEFRLKPEVREEGAPIAETSARPRRTRVWVAYGAAVALGVGAATFGLLARRADKDLDADLGQFPGDRAQVDDDRSRLKTWAAMTDGFAGAALIAAGIGTYFLLAGPSVSDSEGPPRRSAQISLLPSGASVSFSDSF